MLMYTCTHTHMNIRVHTLIYVYLYLHNIRFIYFYEKVQGRQNSMNDNRLIALKRRMDSIHCHRKKGLINVDGVGVRFGGGE